MLVSESTYIEGNNKGTTIEENHLIDRLEIDQLEIGCPSLKCVDLLISY